MYKQCQTESTTRRQRELEQSFLGLLLRQQYEDISVSGLCQELNLPRKAFYRYFSGKEGILYALIDHALMDCEFHNTHKDDESRQLPMIYMQAVFEYWAENKRLLDALKKSGLSGMLVHRATLYTCDLDTLPRFMKIDDRRLREYGTMFMVCGLMSMIVQWHHDGFYKSPEEMAELAMQLFTQPLFSGKMEDI